MYPTSKTHKLMFNPMTIEFVILEAQSSKFSYRGSTWEEIISGSLKECENEMVKLS